MRADFLDTTPQAVPGEYQAVFDRESPELFQNRELSWLAFNWRVLEEADDPCQPLLERLRYLSISGTNLDEFYTVRVAGLRARMRAGVERLSPDGRTPAQQLELIDRDALALQRTRQDTWKKLRGLPSAQARVFVSSAGWMDRNLNRRVEILVEIDNPTVHSQIIDQVMAASLRDEAQSWVLMPDGRYIRAAGDPGEELFSCHDFFIRYPSLSGRGRSVAADAPRLSAATPPSRQKEQSPG